jgi:hypothetical protein
MSGFDEEYLGSGSLSDSDLEDVIRQAQLPESDAGHDDPHSPGFAQSVMADAATYAIEGAPSQDIEDEDLADLQVAEQSQEPVESPKPDDAAQITSQLFVGAPTLESAPSDSKAQDIASEIPGESTEKANGSASDVLTGPKTEV